MNAILKLIREEPALITAVVIAALNMAFTLNAEQVLTVQTIVESILLLIGGGVVRSQVTPVSKLPRSYRG